MALAEPVKTARTTRIFHGWIILAVTFVTSMVTSGIVGYALAFFLVPMTRDLGVSRAAFSGVSIAGLAVLPLMPWLGSLVDRKNGPRTMAVIGGLLTGLAVIVVSMVTAVWQFYVLYGVYYAAMTVGGSLVGPALVAKWFVRKRGRATAISAMGVSIGGLFIAPLAGWLIITYDWRTAWVVLGIIIIVAVVPASFLFIRRSPEDEGLLPDGDTPGGTGARKQTVKVTASEYPWTVRQALRTRAAWLLMMMQALGSMGLLAVLVHQVAYIQEKGFDAGTSLAVASTVAFFSAAGKIPWGLAAERFHVRWVTAACFVLAGLSLMLLVVGDSLPMMYLYAALYGGTFSGMGALTQIVWADYFGRQHAGAIRGAVAPLSSALSASAPLLVGVLWDIQGNYIFAFTLLAAFWVTGGTLALLAPPPKPPAPLPAAGAGRVAA